MTASAIPPAAAQVILLTGPSGSGKSSLAARTGLPVLRLDDFYKEGGDPTLPRFADGDGRVDWDAPGSWDAEAAVTAIGTLCEHGRTTVPVYDIATSARTGKETVDLHGSTLFVAEGIFAAEIAGRCGELGLLADALCLHGRPSTTFRRRLFRDVRESRKSLSVLVRRGWALMRAESSIVARHVSLGAHACGRDEALARIAVLLVRQTAPAARPATPFGRRREPGYRAGAHPEPAHREGALTTERSSQTPRPAGPLRSPVLPP